MRGHVLYTEEDFKGWNGEELEKSILADVVLNGGLSVCKICGEFESGLDDPCKPIKE